MPDASDGALSARHSHPRSLPVSVVMLVVMRRPRTRGRSRPDRAPRRPGRPIRYRAAGVGRRGIGGHRRQRQHRRQIGVDPLRRSAPQPGVHPQVRTTLEPHLELGVEVIRAGERPARQKRRLQVAVDPLDEAFAFGMPRREHDRASSRTAALASWPMVHRLDDAMPPNPRRPMCSADVTQLGRTVGRSVSPAASRGCPLADLGRRHGAALVRRPRRRAHAP